MKTRILLISFVYLLFSCSKEKLDYVQSQENQTFKIRFSASNFTQQIKPLDLKGSTKSNSEQVPSINVNDYFRILNYFVADENNKIIIHGNSHIFDSNDVFHKDKLAFNLELPKGQYKIGLLGSGLGFSMIDNNILSISAASIGTAIFASSLMPLKVEKDSIYEPILLKRLSSKLQIKITDLSPAEKLTIKLITNDRSQIRPFDRLNDDIFSSESELLVYDVLPNSNQNFIETYISPYIKNGVSEKFDFKLIILNQNQEILGIKEIKDVAFKENHITILTGNLFEILRNEKNNSFKSEIVEGYSEEKINQKF
ncbi:hypothetical protein [Sphingobacterium cellulitidis]|uniref:hypothetical protein n=1 Tax=Sphingobacterium cellulitidis TaxID=1768011 RepID=UPI003C7C44A1